MEMRASFGSFRIIRTSPLPSVIICGARDLRNSSQVNYLRVVLPNLLMKSGDGRELNAVKGFALR